MDNIDNINKNIKKDKEKIEDEKSNYVKFAKEIKDKINLNVIFDEPMSKHTTFKIGGNADMFLKISSENDLIFVLKTAKKYNIQVLVIGNGSNILVKDGGIEGLVIYNCIDYIRHFEKSGRNFLEIGSRKKIKKCN